MIARFDLLDLSNNVNIDVSVCTEKGEILVAMLAMEKITYYKYVVTWKF